MGRRRAIRRQHDKLPAAPPPARTDGWLSLRNAGIVAIVLAAGVFAIYSPSLNFQFILDDHRFLNDPRLQSSGHWWEYFTSYVWAQTVGAPNSFYRPVFVLWLRLNFILNEMSSWGWHLLSIAKHVAVAILLGLLVWKLLRDRAAALLAATLFALHPAQAESVAWITVPDPLMAAAVLSALLLYLMYAERRSVDGQPAAEKSNEKSRQQIPAKSKGDYSMAWLFASAAACLAAMMAKETAMVLPAVFFALALITPFGKLGGKKTAAEENPGLGVLLVSAIRATLPFLVVAAAYISLRMNALGGQLSPATQNLPWKTVLLSWPAVLWFYVKVVLWPFQSHAFADSTLVPTFSPRTVLLPALGLCCVAVLLLGGCVWAWRTARRELPDRDAIGVERALLLGAILLVLPILLALNLNALNPGDFLHGRYTYLPLAGLALLFATGWHLAKKAQILLLAAAVLVAVLFSVLTVQQEGMWKDDLTVFTVAHQIAPQNEPVAKNLVRAHVQIAAELADADRCDEAVPTFEQAIQQYPQDWFAWAGLGECQFKRNDLPGAEKSLRRAAELSHEPRMAQAWELVREKMGLSAEPPDGVTPN
jgi:protein O-mannosyl-transferase